MDWNDCRCPNCDSICYTVSRSCAGSCGARRAATRTDCQRSPCASRRAWTLFRGHYVFAALTWRRLAGSFAIGSHPSRIADVASSRGCQVDHLAIVSDVACLRLPSVAWVAWPKLERLMTYLVAAFGRLDAISRSMLEHSSVRLNALLTSKFASMTCSS